MGDLEARFIHAFIPIEEQVQIQSPRTKALRLWVACPSMARFNSKHVTEQDPWRQLRLKHHDGIQVCTLVDWTHRRSLVDSGGPQLPRLVKPGQIFSSSHEPSSPISQIRPQRDKGFPSLSHSSSRNPFAKSLPGCPVEA
jgi:hypothetical protein